MIHTAYTPGKTFFHNWDPRWKLGTSILCISITAATRSFLTLGLLFLMTALSLCVLRISVKKFFGVLQYPLYMMGILFPLLALSSGGETVMTIYGVPLYRDGIVLAGLISLRSCTIMVVVAIVFISTKINCLFKAMDYFFVPKKLLFIFLSTYRFIFYFSTIVKNTFIAARLRGFTGRGTVSYMKVLLHVLVSILIYGFEQTERTTKAMYLRGFQGAIIVLHDFKTKPSDVWKAGICFAPVLLIYLQEILWTQ